MDDVTNYKTEVFWDRTLLCERWNYTYFLESAWSGFKQIVICQMRPVSDNTLLGYLTPSVYFDSLN